MNDEQTLLSPQNAGKTSPQPSINKTYSGTPQTKNMSWGEKAAYAAGGAVVGAGVAVAGQAVAASSAETTATDASTTNATPNTEQAAETQAQSEQAATAAATAETAATTNTASSATATPDLAAPTVQSATSSIAQAAQTSAETHAAPAPVDAIVATATGIRVAQVDDQATFGQAFADARAQVGAGGVFDWHGRVYSTYYKEEWDGMSAAERQEFQGAIDQSDVIAESGVSHSTHTAHSAQAQRIESQTGVASNEAEAQAIPASHTQADASADDVEVRVLQVGETDLNGDGIAEHAALIEVDNQEIMVVDIDHDGTADFALRQHNGQIQTLDLSDHNLDMPTQSDAEAYLAQADHAPDYLNEANVQHFDA